jgi:hypothetical protein
MKALLRCLLLCPVLLLAALCASADECIPYCDIGQISPLPGSVISASADGEVVAYYFGHVANDGSMIRMWDVTSNTYSPWGLLNLTTPIGAQADLGSVSKGDVLVFQLWDALQNNIQPGAGFIYSTDPSMNPDKLNHFYIASWQGGMVGDAYIPAGTFMGGEDLPAPYADWDYNDHEFVWNIQSSGAIVGFGHMENVVVPEPGALQTALLGLFAVSPFLRRRIGA